MKPIRVDGSVMDAQLSRGSGVTCGFDDALLRIGGTAPAPSGLKFTLKAALLDTPLGSMIAIASDSALYLLEFVDCRGLDHELECLRDKTKSAIVSGRTDVISLIEEELALYFNGQLSEFKTTLFLLGTLFQKQVWQELMKIPFGTTRSYLDVATAIGRPSACRAVAAANGANQLAIIIPCHRVINANGRLGGYAGGVNRKAWLINLEKSTAPSSLQSKLR